MKLAEWNTLAISIQLTSFIWPTVDIFLREGGFETYKDTAN